MTQSVLLAATQRATERPLHITLLGPPQLTVRGTPLPLPRRQLRALFYRLAVTLQPVPREQLCFLFWLDIAEAAARRNLTVLLNQLRQALPSPNVILTHGDAILLNPSQVQCDTVAFAEAIALAAQRAELEPLAAAVNLYAGPFLLMCGLPSCRIPAPGDVAALLTGEALWQAHACSTRFHQAGW